jgi:formylglycine-generating enzyme required for sulfatase activity
MLRRLSVSCQGEPRQSGYRPRQCAGAFHRSFECGKRLKMNFQLRNFQLMLLSAVAAVWSSVAAGQTPPEASAVTEPGEIFRDCADCPEMVIVPAGEFSMGSGEIVYEKPEHKVVIASPFAIGRREVTFQEWDRCFVAGGCKHSPDDQGWGRGRRPVIDISWDDARLFLSWLSRTTKRAYRLPSEAEWEYAARAGTDSPFWWGRSTDGGNAVCEDCSALPPRQTLPAGSMRPNGFGLYDVAGNAAEWVEDCWHESYRGAPTDGSPWIAGQCRLRVLRGGSFGSKMSMVRPAARFRYDQDVRYYANGFRVARDLR